MVTVRQLLEDKGRAVWSVQADASVFEALSLMAQQEIGALLVLDGDEPVGMLSERDYARKIVLVGRASRDTQVADIMSTTVVHVSPDETVRECMGIMTERKIRHLPVMEYGRVVGMVSIGDLVKSIIAEQEFVIAQMTSYINGAALA